jgi:hypothetical protein
MGQPRAGPAAGNLLPVSRLSRPHPSRLVRPLSLISLRLSASKIYLLWVFLTRDVTLMPAAEKKEDTYE